MNANYYKNKNISDNDNEKNNIKNCINKLIKF